MPTLWHASLFDPRVKPERGTYELDRDHPLARGALLLSQFDEGGGCVASNLATPSLPGVLAGGTTFACDGAVIGTTAATSCVNYGNSAYLCPSLAVTVAALVTMPNNLPSGTQYKVLAREQAASPFDSYQLARQSNANTTFDFSVANASTNVTAGAFTAVAGQSYGIVGTYDGAQVRLFINGILQASAAQSGTILASAANTMVGKSDAYGNAGASMRVRQAIVSSRAWSPSEVAAWYAEPYAMLRPLVRRTYSVPATATATLFRRTRSNRTGSRTAAA